MLKYSNTTPQPREGGVSWAKMEITEAEQEKKKKKKRTKINEDSLRDLWDNIKHTNTHIIRA